MPPRIRTRTTKALKENFIVSDKYEGKPIRRVTKTTRKALADKTNSLSDDNASIEVPTRGKKLVHKAQVATVDIGNKRPRRERRLPTRYVENHVLNNLSKSKDRKEILNTGTPLSTDAGKSLFKTPSKDLESSLVGNRAKRIRRLPPKFEDHSVSPIKAIPIQPCYASTPIPQKSSKTSLAYVESNVEDNKPRKKTTQPIKTSNKKVVPLRSDSSSSKSSPDTNNNAKRQSVRVKRAAAKAKLPSKKVNSKINKNDSETSPKHKHSLKILENIKESSDKNINIDIYEFTYDPNEEPPPQKKKRKRTVRKKPTKPNIYVFKSNYNDNISKALNDLKSKVTKKSEDTNLVKISSQENTAPDVYSETNKIVSIPVVPYTNKSAEASVQEMNHATVNMEDIATDFEQIVNNDDHMNYSPVNSPHSKTPDPQPVNAVRNDSPVTIASSNDPLNLQDDLSFFDSQPVASSSMNVSVRHPLASPWRVEFGSLPIKWQADTYLKPNMTPAVECSFINSDDNKRKHVYTNMVPETNDMLPDIAEKTSNLKQMSIIGFMKEVAERSLNRKKTGRSSTPKNINFVFDDINNTSGTDFGYKTPKKARKDNENASPNKNTEKHSNSSNETASYKESSDNTEKNIDKAPSQSPQKQNENDCTYFGFDDSENQDQENVSPVKNVGNVKLKALRPRSRAVLQEINAQTGPTRALLPVAAKSKVATSSEAVNKVYEELKSAEDAPLFPEKNTVHNIANMDVGNPSVIADNDDSQSVHLFEDIEVVHHLKPFRKSYGKAKRVAFQKHFDSDSDVNDGDRMDQAKSSDEDDLSDPSFKMPTIKPRKITKKKTIKKQKSKKEVSKKEEQEAEAWAAGFNSMCEDIEEFPLVVE